MWKLLLIFVALSSCGSVMSMFGSNLMDEINESISQITSSLDNDIKNLNKDIENMNRNIQEGINKQLHETRDKTTQAISRAGHGGRTAYSTHTLNVGPGVQSNAASFATSSSAGSSKSSQSGVNAKGQSYRLEKEESIVGDILYYVQRYYNLDEGTVTETKYSINLSDPSAEPTDKTTTTYNIE